MINMKKILIFSLVALCMGAMIGCSSCKKDNKEPVTADLNVENVTNTDKQYMFTTYGEDYRWFETCILLSDWLSRYIYRHLCQSKSEPYQYCSKKDEV